MKKILALVTLLLMKLNCIKCIVKFYIIFTHTAQLYPKCINVIYLYACGNQTHDLGIIFLV